METKGETTHKYFQEKIIIFFVASVVFTALSFLRDGIFHDSSTPYFKYLADSFKQGKLDLAHQIQVPIDLVLFNGKYFLYWPPMPAFIHLLLDYVLPFRITDVLANIIFAALNGSLVIHLLYLISKRIVRLNRNLISLLTIFFVFGTSNFPLSPYGTVWAVSQIYGITFVLLAFISALQWRGPKALVLCSIFIGCAFLCRLTLIVNIIWPGWFLIANSKSTRSKIYNFFSICTILIVFIALYGWYNWERFGSFFEIGYKYHRVSSFFIRDFQSHGAFSIFYIPQNFYYHFLKYPFPFSDESYMGGSFFLLSPLYFYLFRLSTANPFKSHIIVLLSSVVISYIPISLIMGTGMVQFGSRYLLDFSIPALMLLVFSTYDIKNFRLPTILVIISIVHFAIGTVIKSF